MRLCSAIFISVILHAAVLALPVSLFEAGDERAVPVLVLNEGDTGGGTEAGGQRGKPERRPAPPRGRPMTQPELLKTEGVDKVQPPTEGATQIHVSVEESVDDGVALATSSETDVSATHGISGNAAGERVGEGNFGGGVGSGGAGSNPGGGSGGGSPGGSAYAQAHYAYNPKPHYPERARKEGREGTVILTVLVNQKGKPERVEVGRSSGFAMLDQAAAETVRLWLFQPARCGEKRVESWVRIPIVFRLTDGDGGR